MVITAMTAAQSRDSLVPIGDRIRVRLDELGKTPSWLAEKTGVPRSTITRILNRDRNPTPRTLHEIAPVLGVEVSQLVAGTDAANRVTEAQDIVSRRDYDSAVGQVIEYERKANDLAARIRELVATADHERERAAGLRSDLDAAKQESRLLREDLDRARREALHHQHDARRYREGLQKAVSHVAQLQAQVRELGLAVEAGHRTGRVGVILAGVAAAVSVAHYLSSETAEEQRKAADSRPPKATKGA